MLVVRFTIPAKVGCTSKLVKWVKSWPDYGIPLPPHGWRVYREAELAPWGVVVHEVEFESLAEYEVWWKQVLTSPRIGELVSEMNKLKEQGGGGELWSMEVLK